MKNVRMLLGVATLGVCLSGPLAAQRRTSTPDDTREYERAVRLLDRRDYEETLRMFNSIADQRGAHADGALYWKAYTLSKLGRQQEAMTALAELQRSYASSRWLNDAKALEVELRARSGQPVQPDQEADEDLKLMAINSLMQQDPARALPTLQKILQGSASPKLKERALFVMAQTNSQQSRDILVQVAKGGNPDLQMKAIEYLGVFGGQKNAQLLADIYSSNPDVNVKRRILNSFMVMNDRPRLLEVARNEKNTDLRRRAIELMGAAGARTELVQMYSSEPTPELKKAVLNGLFVANDAPALVQIARSEKDMQLKKAAVEKLSHMRSKEASDYLMELLNKD